MDKKIMKNIVSGRYYIDEYFDFWYDDFINYCLAMEPRLLKGGFFVFLGKNKH
ncbi:hypothetical protein [Propionispira arboris]|jgi:hypothetical protein|uniref:hypothetical protein n=1 Tax=Propionispira arboris TaxID=84035 RepID=UPI0015A5F78E|nr:hypothetical protein [Propionispira arboris]